MKKVTLEQIEEALDLPAEKWKGRCYEIASGMVKTGVTDGRAVYGHFLGEVAKDSRFHDSASKCSFVQHGWVVLDNGTILDPTRWVFEDVEPYLFVGHEKANAEYDEGGNRFREAMMRPAPEFDPDSQMTEIEFSGPTDSKVRKMLNHPEGPFSFEQMMWLANVPLHFLGPMAYMVYEAIVEWRPALIPIDNRRKVLGDC